MLKTRFKARYKTECHGHHEKDGKYGQYQGLYQ
jgi:hypothetical protein